MTNISPAHNITNIAITFGYKALGMLWIHTLTL